MGFHELTREEFYQWYNWAEKYAAHFSDSPDFWFEMAFKSIVNNSQIYPGMIYFSHGAEGDKQHFPRSYTTKEQVLIWLQPPPSAGPG